MPLPSLPVMVPQDQQSRLVGRLGIQGSAFGNWQMAETLLWTQLGQRALIATR